MKTLWCNFTQHPKTSVMGMLIFIGLTARTVAPYYPRWANTLTLITGLCAAYLGAIMKDAGTQLAVLDDGKATGVPAHETPDNPAEKPVKP